MDIFRKLIFKNSENIKKEYYPIVHINGIIDDKNNSLKSILNSINNNLNKFYKKINKQSSDIIKLGDRITGVYNSLLNKIQNIKITSSGNNTIDNFILGDNIYLSCGEIVFDNIYLYSNDNTKVYYDEKTDTIIIKDNNFYNTNDDNQHYKYTSNYIDGTIINENKISNKQNLVEVIINNYHE